jgi:hypothetical protein
MDTLRFSTNWNHKLDCDCFTSIREYSKERFFPGREIQIELKGEAICKARVVLVRECYIDNLTELDCYLDTGYSKAETIRILETMYKNRPVNVHTQKFALVLLKKIKEPGHER